MNTNPEQVHVEVKVVAHHITAAAQQTQPAGYVSSLECCLLDGPTNSFKVPFKGVDAPAIDSIITISYRDLTDAGIPRHASYKASKNKKKRVKKNKAKKRQQQENKGQPNADTENKDKENKPPPVNTAAAPATSSGSLYDVLGVVASCSLKELKAAYKAAVLNHHPDKGGNPIVFQAVQDAYAVLGKKATREQYDKTGAGLAGDQSMVGTRVPAKRGGKRKAKDAAAPPPPVSMELAPALGVYTMEELADIGGVQLEACQFVKVQGSKNNVYEVKRSADGTILHCSCPVWRFQRCPPALRAPCKHCNAVSGLGLPAGMAPKKLRV